MHAASRHCRKGSISRCPLGNTTKVDGLVTKVDHVPIEIHDGLPWSPNRPLVDRSLGGSDLLKGAVIAQLLKVTQDPWVKAPRCRAIPDQCGSDHCRERVRNLLFGGTDGRDLIAVNIQRGRDHGLPDYNTLRQDYGLPAVSSFADITSNATLAADRFRKA